MITDADNADDIAILANTPNQAETLLHSLERAAAGRAKAWRPARTYIQQLCEDTGCSPEYLPEAMNDREK